MKKETILHIPMSEYAHGLDERRIVLRLRAAGRLAALQAASKGMEKSAPVRQKERTR